MVRTILLLLHNLFLCALLPNSSVEVESIFGNIPHLYQIHLDWWFDAFNPLLADARKTKQLIQVNDLVQVFVGIEEK